MSAGDKVLRAALGLVHGWTDVAVPRMARSDHIQRSPEVTRFSLSDKRIATERVRTG